MDDAGIQIPACVRDGTVVYNLHVHLLVHYPPEVQLSKLINSLKGASARYLFQGYDAHAHRHP
ncbi:transposase [Streptomyces sp. NPDC059371]|uniref:transposase n=1 Tax=Streptomyces sp. NPDC059371 TaxID=3346812 RepID=UPI0036B1136F